jgi:hypothetical protein
MELNIDAVLTMVTYAAITGVLNLLLTERSRVDAWAEAHPKLAALLKVLRAIGFDPWHAIAALSLFFKGKLPTPKQPHAKIIPPGTGVFLLAIAIGSAVGISGCSAWTTAKPVVRTVNDVARDLCVTHFGEKSKLSPEEVAREFCERQKDLAPWLDWVLAAKQGAAIKAKAPSP